MDFRSQQAFRLAGAGHPVGEHDDRAASIAQEAPCGGGQHLRELAGRAIVLRLGGNLQRSRFGGQLASTEGMALVAPLAGQIREHILRAGRRRGRHHHGLEAAPEWRLGPRPELPNGPKRLQKGLGAVRLVEKDEAVVGNESRVHRPRPGATPVGPEQQAGAELVDGGRNDGRLQRIACPSFRTVHPSAQRMYGQGMLVSEPGHSTSGETPEAVRNRLQDPALGRLQLPRQTLRPVVGFVDDDSPIHHEEYSARGGNGATRSEAGCLRGEREYRDVEASGLASPRRQSDGIRPRLRTLCVRRRRTGNGCRLRIA